MVGPQAASLLERQGWNQEQVDGERLLSGRISRNQRRFRFIEEVQKVVFEAVDTAGIEGFYGERGFQGAHCHRQARPKLTEG